MKVQIQVALAAMMLCSLISQPALAQGRATVGIGEIRNSAGAPHELVAGLVDMMTTSLVKTGKFDVVERERLGDVANEQLLGQSGAVDESTAARTGQVKGAGYLLIGAVTEASISKRSTGFGGVPLVGRLTISKRKIALAIDVRFVDSETSSVRFAETFRKEETKTGVSTGLVSFDLESGPVAALAREVVNGITRRITLEVYPPKIVKFTESTGKVILNYGDILFSVGDIYDVFSLGEELIDPDTGESLGSERSKIGQIEIESVLGKTSTGKLLSGEIVAGAVCMPSENQPKKDSGRKRGRRKRGDS